MPDIPSIQQFDEESRMCLLLRKCLQDEEVLLKQKSRIHWLHHGDKNNRFFFNSCQDRWNSNKILMLEDDTGQLLSTHKDISDAVVHFYKNMLGTEVPVEDFSDDITLPTLSESQRVQLAAPFSEQDVFKTMKSMAKHKCSGPDGFPVEFFLEAWHIVGADVTRGILYYFQSLQLPRIINSAALALVPKVFPAHCLSHYRPISCCNVLYKCISKILAARMKLIMPSIISDCQSAFVPNRLIGDNILFAQSLCRNYHLQSGQPRCAIKLDLRKAFDSVSWILFRKPRRRWGFRKSL